MYGTLISSVTVGAGGASSIDFTGIPGTYTDLVLVLSVRDSWTPGVAQTIAYLKFNGSSSGYSGKQLYGTGSATGSANGSTTNIDFALGNSNSATSSTFGNCIVTIPNYAGSSNKSMSIDAISESNTTQAVQSIAGSMWANSSAITSIAITPVSSPWLQYSTAYLYGLTKGSGGATVS